MSATMQDVARLAGVSAKTVSNVLNDHPYVSDATRGKVLAAVGALGYQMNTAARSLRTGTTATIGLAVPELRLLYFAELADDVIDVAARHGLTVIIETTRGTRQGELQVLSGPRRHMTDGLIFSPLALGPGDEDLLVVEYPLVLLGERILSGPVDHVTMQNVAAARAATEYLRGLGRRRIAAIGVNSTEVMGSAVLRLRGYREALEAAGERVDEALCGETPFWNPSTGMAAMAAVLDRGARPDAVFAFNDALALGALHELQLRGISVPGDVAVIGFDNIEEAEYSTPALSSVDPGRAQIAETAVTMLAEQIAERAAWRPVPGRQVHAGFAIAERAAWRPVPGRQVHAGFAIVERASTAEPERQSQADPY